MARILLGFEASYWKLMYNDPALRRPTVDVLMQTCVTVFQSFHMQVACLSISFRLCCVCFCHFAIVVLKRGTFTMWKSLLQMEITIFEERLNDESVIYENVPFTVFKNKEMSYTNTTCCVIFRHRR